MAELEFDPIARKIGRQRVVSFECYVSEPLSKRRQYCLVTNAWFDDWLLVNQDDVVASIAGTTRTNGQSIVWVKSRADVVTKDGTKTHAYDVALALGVEESTRISGSPQPPPTRPPK